MKRVYDLSSLSMNNDLAKCVDIVDLGILRQIIADANRYQLLKTADRGELSWFGNEGGYIDFDFDDDWDAMIDNAFD